MDIRQIRMMVHSFYWKEDLNCATTVMKVLSTKYFIKVEEQVIHSLVGMHGAGKYGAQCGLVEGSLMFIGIIGNNKGFNNDEIIDLCYKFAKEFEDKFGSLQCSILRPEGFRESNPPHLCEELTNKVLNHTIQFIDDNIVYMA